MTAEYVTKDSGERREFSTGARRDTDAGKPMIRRIPPLVRERLGGLYARGAAKYCDADDPVENWKHGIPLHVYLESLHHHLTALEMGQEDEDHEAAVLWNMAGFMWTKAQIRRGNLPQSLAATHNAVVREYDGATVLCQLQEPARDTEERCGWKWHRGRCTLPAGHSGDHAFPTPSVS